MKELSIEEKAKRYDEAIKKVNDYYEGKTKLYSDVDKTLEYLFPALKESEDEIIRKELINYVEKHYATGRSKVDKLSVLAWLEKQGEQPIKITSKHAEGKLKEMLNDITETKDKKIKKSLINYINAYGNGGDFTKEEYINWLRKQSEKKPTSVNSIRTWLYIVADVLTEFNGIGQYLDSSDCREMAERLREKYCFDDTSSDWQKVYQKGLKVGEIYGRNKAEKEQKQKLVEWSEEDERIYRSIIYSFVHNFPLVIPQQEFVKSLKDRYTWKPSDLQIEALESATENCAYSEYQDCLRELIAQLKKLKG